MQTISEELFLKRIAQELIDKHGKDLHRVVVVLPSNRSKVFLKKFLFEILGSAFLTPHLLLLPQFVKSVVKERTEEKLSLLLIRKVLGKKRKRNTVIFLPIHTGLQLAVL